MAGPTLPFPSLPLPSLPQWHPVAHRLSCTRQMLHKQHRDSESHLDLHWIPTLRKARERLQETKAEVLALPPCQLPDWLRRRGGAAGAATEGVSPPVLSRWSCVSVSRVAFISGLC